MVLKATQLLQIFFSEKPHYKQVLRLIAWVWTLVIVLLCFIPSNEVPEVNIPFLDKYAHFILFGGFAFLWLASFRIFKKWQLPLLFFIALCYGWLIEVLQGMLPLLGRSKDPMDILADGVGGLMGVISFYIGYTFYSKNKKEQTV